MARIVKWSCALTVLLTFACLTTIESRRLGGGGRRTWGGSVSKPRPTFSHTSSNVHSLSYTPRESSGVHSRRPSAPPAPSHDSTVHRDVGWNVGAGKPAASGTAGHDGTVNRDIGWNVGAGKPAQTGNIGWNTGQNPGRTNAGAPPPYPGHTGSNAGPPPPYPGYPGSHGTNSGPPPPYPGYPGSHGTNYGPPPPYPGYPGHNTHMGAPPPYHTQTHYSPNTHYPGQPGYGGYPSQPTYSGGFPVGYPGGGYGGYHGGFGGYGSPGYGGYGSPGFGGFGGLGGMAGIASGYSNQRKSSGISAGTAISGALLGLTLWNLARDHNHYHVYYPYSHNRADPVTGNTVTTNNLSPGQASVSSYIGNMSCITVYDARSVQRWANKTLQDFHNAFPKTPLPGSENGTAGYNFTVIPGDIIHRERMVMTCCATAGAPVKLSYLSSGKLSDVNCLQQSYIMPFRKLKFVPINATATNTTNQNSTSASNSTESSNNSTQLPNNSTEQANTTNSTLPINPTQIVTTNITDTNAAANVPPDTGNVTRANSESSNQNTSVEATAVTINNVEVTTIKT